MTHTVRVELPSSLRLLAAADPIVEVTVAEPATLRAVVEALERAYPALCGTIRDQVTGERRPFLRFFACRQDLSHTGMEARLPQAVCRGEEPLLVIGAIAGG